jgi:hypothetical protein
MFLFTKTHSDYEKIDDVETRCHSRSPDTETFSKNDNYQHYRAAFFGLSALYLLTIISAIVFWQYPGIKSDKSAASPNKVIESMPYRLILKDASTDEHSATRPTDNVPEIRRV